MFGRFNGSRALTLATAMLLCGCVQATRHSNTMVFGTNTVFGVAVGTDPSQVPTATVGYRRQELVLLPLVANTASQAPGEKGMNRLEPCDLTAPVTVSGGTFAVHPCSLVGVNGKAMDSYSVLASFGAKFDTGSGAAKGGLAQYFATGIAAQMLALTGGASVVAVGDSAGKSADHAQDSANAVAALYSGEPAFAVGQAAAKNFKTFIEKLQARMTLASDAERSAKILAFETVAKIPGALSIAPACAKLDDCKAQSKAAYGVWYQQNAQALEDALKAWN